MKLDVAEIARRAARRAFAERGNAEQVSAHPSRPSVRGVHVVVEPSDAPAAKHGKGRELVTAQCLAATPDGGTYSVPDAAVVTPLAEEEAHRRRIRLARGAVNGRKRVAVGSDHGGFALKKDVLAWIAEVGHQPIDLGTRDERACDYPDFAHAVAEVVAGGQAELGIVIDGAGIGSAIAANKVPGVRAATCCDVAMAKNSREHNFANVLSLGAKMITRAVAQDIVRAFLATETGEERHRKRVDKIDAIERRYMKTNREGVRP